jgi:hypothetical protein
MIVLAAASALAVVALLAALAARRGSVTRHLLDRAVERLPPDRRERYAKEWAADLAQLEGVRRLTWALGLPRAASRLARTFGHRRPRQVPLRALPQVAFDAAALAGSYAVAYRLRFSGGVPEIYRDLFWQTVPFAALGGLAVLAAFGLYRDGGGPLRVAQAVFVTALAVVGYVAVVHPKLVITPTGQVALMPPAGVLALFATSASLLLLVSRQLTASARA